jgi:polysaccharide deacetylase family protein (PEP-CTERM system associated)
VFSVDLEDWFHLLELDGAPPIERWDALPSRLERNTKRLLALLDVRHVKATFFVLGWVAARFPGLVRQIADCGHEIASHGHTHGLVWSQQPSAFRDDVRRASDAIEAACGRRPIGYRAPGFSIVERTPWALDILADEGFVYDSSIFPAARAHGGIAGARPGPWRLPCGLFEFPVSTVGLRGARVGYLGGGYLRALPRRLVLALARSQARLGRDLVLYVHPRDIDPGQPRLPMSWRRHVRTYIGLRGTLGKLAALLEQHSWGRFRDRPELGLLTGAGVREQEAWS